MPRTKVQRQTSKRNRDSDEDGLKWQLKEMQRIHDEFQSESIMIWQRRKEIVADLAQKLRYNLSNEEMEMTMGEILNGKSNRTDSLLTEASRATTTVADDDESSSRSSRPKKTIATEPKKKQRRSKSAAGISNLSTMSARPLSRANSTIDRLSRSKFRTPGNRLQTMSADRSVMTPVTPKIQMNTPVSFLRYPKVGETIIGCLDRRSLLTGNFLNNSFVYPFDDSMNLMNSSLCISGAMQGIANTNIPIKDGMFSMQPNAITDVDSVLVSRIDNTTMRQLKQLQANLNFVMSTINSKRKN